MTYHKFVRLFENKYTNRSYAKQYKHKLVFHLDYNHKKHLKKREFKKRENTMKKKRVNNKVFALTVNKAISRN